MKNQNIYKWMSSMMIYLLVLIQLQSQISCITWVSGEKKECNVTEKNVSYKIIRDDLDTSIDIAVDSRVDKDELCKAMSLAADKHQNSKGRDYLFTDYLWVNAYLVQDSYISEFPAGKLRRQVPVKESTTEKKVNDLITVNLEEARQNIEQKMMIRP